MAKEGPAAQEGEMRAAEPDHILLPGTVEGAPAPRRCRSGPRPAACSATPRRTKRGIGDPLTS